MLKVDAVSLDQMEHTYPGIKKTIASFEAMVLPPCSHCGWTDTAFVEIGVIGRTIALSGATTKVKLLAIDRCLTSTFAISAVGFSADNGCGRNPSRTSTSAMK